MKKEKETKGTENAQIAELLAELAQARAELAAEKAKKRTSKKSIVRPAHVEFLKSSASRAVLAIAATGKQATALVPAYLAVTLLSQGSHATGAARQMALLVSRGVSYTAGVMPNLLPAAILERFDALKEDIQTVTGWLELVGLNDDYNIIPKEYLQEIADSPDKSQDIYVKFLNDLRLQSLAVQRKAFTPEQFAKIEENSREVYPWNFESWEVSSPEAE